MPWLPESVSTFGGDMDRIFYVILWITGIIFVLVEATLLWFVFRYRHRDGRKAEHIHGNWKVEVVWTAVPFLIVLVLGAMSWGPWSTAKGVDRLPPDALEISVHAKQFEWNVTYPGPDGELGTGDDFERRNQLHVPANRPVLVHLSSEDVIHSFFLPQFRVKQDVVPGMDLSAWFEATEPGQYTLACAELCGTGHTRMMGSVTVYAPDEFDAWSRGETTTGN
jgi:cytochrome c oxidase subunit 2